ncbi:MAG: hypothetical protein ACLPV8_11295 [Steroidobacteraceae bacterium]
MTRGSSKEKIAAPPAFGALPKCISLLLKLAAPLLGCSNYHHRAYRLDHPQIQSEKYVLNFVEADDEGWFWAPPQAAAALQSVSESAQARDTIVLLFIHGWHHSAACCDDNVEGFKQVLEGLYNEVHDNPMFSTARRKVHRITGATDDYRVIGIYIGWRGSSLPGWLDYLTFWGRKSAAKRVGETDLCEFMARLQSLYSEHNAPAPAQGAASNTYLGLVSVGHSFGSQVLIRAVAGNLEHELEERGAASTYLRQTDHPPVVDLKRAAQGYGDLIFLINPAVEAAAYERLFMLSRRFSYPKEQTPLLLTVSADNDGARHTLFEWGRVAGEVFTSTPYKPDPRERIGERKALGVYGDPRNQPPDPEIQLTHTLTPSDPDVKLVGYNETHTPEPYCEQAGPCTCEFYRWSTGPKRTLSDSLSSTANTDAEIAALEEKVSVYDFSASTQFANVSLNPLPGGLPYQPMIMASAPPNIIDGHNGMFSQPLLDFLTKYLGFIEAKRYLITANAKHWMTQH